MTNRQFREFCAAVGIVLIAAAATGVIAFAVYGAYHLLKLVTL